MKKYTCFTFFACVLLLAGSWIILNNANALYSPLQHRVQNSGVKDQDLQQSSVQPPAINHSTNNNQQPKDPDPKRIGQGFTSILMKPLQEKILTPKNRVVLCLGVDARKNESARSDTILLTVLSPKKQRMTTISIPRDLYISIPGKGMTKINHAMAYGGVPLIKQTIERWLAIHIDNYAVVNFAGLRSIVDELGGVDLQVEKDMDYVDPTDSTSIHLKAGYQHLNGQQALDYVRFRHDAMADTGRMGRQQKLVRAMMHTGLKMENWPKLMANLGILRDHIDTDLSPLELARLAHQYGNIRPNSVDSITIKGLNRINPIDQLWYFYPEPNETYHIAQIIKTQLSS